MKSAERVFELRKNNPQLPAAEIARITGLSRERVRQILVSLGLAANVEKEGWGKITLVCDNCGKEFTRLGSQYRHSIAKQGCRHTYCSRRCFWQVIGRMMESSRVRVREILPSPRLPANFEKEEYGKITLLCDNCGKEFTRLGSQYRRSIARQGCRHTYCSLSCFWQVIGRNYGFGKLKSRNQPAEESVDALS